MSAIVNNTVQLSDVIDTIVFQDLPPVDGPEKTAFYESGIVVSNPLLTAVAQGPSKTVELPFWRDIDPDNEPNRSTDRPADEPNVYKIEQGEQTARKAFLNKGLSETDLASELVMGGDAMTRIRARVDTYWRRQWQRRLLATCRGLLADNLASQTYQDDMVFDASQTTATTTSVFTRSNFTAAAFTMGDMYDELAAIAVHSMIYKRMIDNDDIEFIPDSQGNMTIPTFLGHRIIVDDSMPVIQSSGADNVFVSILFGQAMFGFGEGSPRQPVEVERNERGGRGAGVETLWTRKTWLLHPFGYRITPGVVPAPTGQNPEQTFTLAELAAAGTWQRVVERKNVPLAFLLTN